MTKLAISWLRARLPQSRDVGPTRRDEFQDPGRRNNEAIDIRGPNGTFTTMIVEEAVAKLRGREATRPRTVARTVVAS